jgi:tRNA 2-thiouridine synthesizing protein E
MGRSIYLNQQFPGSTAKLVALFAGLPKPKNCL